MSDWVHGSEGKEGSGGEGLEESQETKSYREKEKEKENIEIPPISLRQDTRGRSCPIGGG